MLYFLYLDTSKLILVTIYNTKKNLIEVVDFQYMVKFSVKYQDFNLFLSL
jgi:hypothetical protein